MSVLLDTSVVIDHLRGSAAAAHVLEAERAKGILNASEITRLEVLAGMRATEENRTRSVLSAIRWHPVDGEVAERAGALGRQWLRAFDGLDSADLAIAATALLLQARLLTKNVRHFPMIEGLQSPY